MKGNKGITLITLILTIIVIIILTFTININLSKYSDKKIKANFEQDMQKLKEEIIQYYAREKKIPIINKYTNVSMLGNSKNVNDNENYYVIDIKKLPIEKLNYGQDYIEISKKDKDVAISDLLDVYIINEQSHTIYYPKGIEYEKRVNYTLERNNSEIEDRIIIWGEENLQVAKKTKLVAKIMPSNIEAEVTWASSNEQIATINDKGEVTPLKEGTATITATAKADSTMKRNFEITVENMLIESKEDLILFQEFVNAGHTFEGCTAKLVSDIDLAESETEQWVPINNFAGTFDGNGHVIQNLYYKGNNYDKVGLFANNRGIIQNLIMENIYIYNSYENNEVTHKSTGGIVGYSTNKIINCGIRSGTIQIDVPTVEKNERYWSNIGGITGANTGEISNCYNKATIKAKNSNKYDQIEIGGVTGSNRKMIKNCYNIGSIEAEGNCYLILRRNNRFNK